MHAPKTTMPGQSRELTCPTCKTKLVYDPDDPMHHTSGALLTKAGAPRPVIVYLTCSLGHVNRYSVS